MAEPGTIIAAITLSYSGALLAWATFQDALNYDDASADLVVRLEVERFRLQTWGKNAGLPSSLDAALHPIHTLLGERLRRIETLFSDAAAVTNAFGLSAAESTRIRSEKVHSVLAGMAASMRSVGLKPDMEEKIKELDKPGLAKRVCWTLTSKSKFSTLVAGLETHIDKLNALLTETQRRSVRDDWTRINIVIVGNIPEGQLDFVKQALRQDGTGHAASSSIAPIEQLVEKKAISVRKYIPSASGPRSLQLLNLLDFKLPHNFSAGSRFLAAAYPSILGKVGRGPFLLEKKQYDPDITYQDKELLKARLQRLILLLSSPKSADFRTFRAVGYCNDVNNCCWWLVFHFPISDDTSSISAGSQPLSLSQLFPLPLKPPLEQRLHLASQLSKTLAELYNSGWMHKGIRSSNILFPVAHDDSGSSAIKQLSPEQHQATLSSPFVAGFEYSRQDSEAATIDSGQLLRTITAAIYRHPDYQGAAASGYRTRYDIYAFGLVLLEIALWVPLSTLLDEKVSEEKARKARKQGAPPAVWLSPKMDYFHKAEALELKYRVLGRLNSDLPFRVGSRMCAVIRYCLEQEDSETEEWHPALGFHNNVVMPLEKCMVVFEDEV